MAERFTLSADLEELLQEIAGDETARLLKVGRRGALRAARDNPPHVSASTPFLSRAERRLLEVHRDEMSRLLYRYSLLIAQEDPRVAARMHYGDALELPRRSVLNVRAAAVVTSRNHEGADVLRSCMMGSEGLDALSVLAVASRLAPSISIRIMQANNLALRGVEIAQAEAILLAIAAGGGGLTSYAWEALGFIAAKTSDYSAACKRYRSALDVDPGRRMPALMWLRFAFLAGSQAETIAAVDWVDDRFDLDDPTVEWCAKAMRAGNELRATSESRRLRSAIADNLGPVSLRVVDGELRA